MINKIQNKQKNKTEYFVPYSSKSTVSLNTTVTFEAMSTLVPHLVSSYVAQQPTETLIFRDF